MKLTKEECKFALKSFEPRTAKEHFKGGYYSFVKAYSIIEQLINEHFDNMDSSCGGQVDSSLTREKLEKALDKACDELSGLDNEYALWFNQMVDKNGLYSYLEPKNEKQWKEYLINED